eukprot:9559658-Lingulodinium_polyedra.AAC.1
MGSNYYKVMREKYQGCQSLKKCLTFENAELTVNPALRTAIMKLKGGVGCKAPLLEFLSSCSELNEREVAG